MDISVYIAVFVCTDHYLVITDIQLWMPWKRQMGKDRKLPIKSVLKAYL